MSVYFDPTINNEYLEISPTNSNLELTGDFTIEFFIKYDTNGPSQYPIILAGYYNTQPTNLIIFAYRNEAPGKICLVVPTLGVITGTTVINNNLWHHVAVVRNNTPAISSLPAISKLRAYYKFDADSIQGNKIANYASGSPVYDATLMNGASINTTDYKRGNGSLQFNASLRQYLQLPTFTYSSEGFSFAIWFKSNNSGAWARIMDFGFSPDNNNVLITVNQGGNNYLKVLYNQTFLGGENVNYNNNVWTHLVLTINPNGEWKTYINGVLKTTAGHPYPTLVQNNLVWLGKSLYTDSADADFNGLMDECLVYDTVLTAQDVGQIYSASNNTKLYVDGIMNTQFSTNYTINYNINNKLLIAKNDPDSPESSTLFKGSLSNLRIVNGTAVYTSNFTPPTTSLTNISGTALLLFNNPSDLFVDGSPNNYTVTKFTSPNFPTASADAPVTYSPPSPPSPSVPCFKENSKILCLVDGIEKELLVQDIRKGVLVKTLLNGYVPVDMIGTSKLFNPANSDRYTDRLYLCSQEMYPELNEDLVITGCHSILVDDFLNQDQRDKTIDVLGNVYITNNKYRLPACVDNRAVPYEKEGTFNIYHIALENENYYSNYGVYANGLLVETCSKRYLKELSNMKLI